MKEIFSKFNIELNDSQFKKFDLFCNFLIEENKKYDLTAISTPEEIYKFHFLDSLLGQMFLSSDARVLDIGAGAGFPSIPLKILRSDLNFTLIDSLRKRVEFLNKSSTLLEFSNFESFHTRIEDFAKTNRNSFDFVVARGLAKLPTLLEYSLPFLKIGGQCIFYKSSTEEEVLKSQNALKILGCEISQIFSFDLFDRLRTFVIVDKIVETPKTYPRNKNLPRLNPL